LGNGIKTTGKNFLQDLLTQADIEEFEKRHGDDYV
jgi:hypothetical protein